MQALSSAYLNVAEFCTTAKAAFQNARKSGSSSAYLSVNSLEALFTDD